jgi:hypothetical protein
MITPHNLYDKNGIFGLVYKGTSTEMAALPSNITDQWSEGDLWYDTTNNLYKTYDGTSWIASGPTSTVTISTVDYAVPLSAEGLTGNLETMADTSNDDITLGEVTIATGNTVEAQIADIGTATVGRVTRDQHKD